jgi:hypothetical protein
MYNQGKSGERSFLSEPSKKNKDESIMALAEINKAAKFTQRRYTV